MKRMVLAMLAVAGLTTPAMAEPTTYTVDGGLLEVLVTYNRDAWIAGHDHVLSSRTFSGTVVWDPEDLSACAVSISLPVESLEVDAAGAREKHGYEGTTSDGDKKSIKKNALGKSQLNSSVFPAISYTSTSCVQSGDRVVVSGNLTIIGVSAPVKSTMVITADGNAFRGQGRFSSSHAAFGIKPYSIAMGALKNADKLGFTVDVRATKQ